MKELLEYLAKSIATKPDAVEVTEEKSEGGFLLLKLKVDPEDMGLVIGKGGKIIRSIRNLVRIKAIREGVRVDVELVEVPGYQKKGPESEAKEATPEKELPTAVEPTDAPEEPKESAAEEEEKKKKKTKGKKTEEEDSETSPEPRTEVSRPSK